jgi:hypothetical protein
LWETLKLARFTERKKPFSGIKRIFKMWLVQKLVQSFSYLSCTPKEFVNMSRCFWEERLSGVFIYKNDILLNHFSVTLTVGSHLKAPYGFWRHINDVTGKESIYLNITDNFLEGTNFNYSCTPLNTLDGCRQDYVMLEVHTDNSIQNIPSCSTLVTLETKDVIPITNYCKAIKVIKNVESNSVGVKLLSGSCDIQVEDKTGYRFYISMDKGFVDFSMIFQKYLVI